MLGEVREVVKVKCSACNGRCYQQFVSLQWERKVLDKETSERRRLPVMKIMRSLQRSEEAMRA
jgi:ribosomal protein L33